MDEIIVAVALEEECLTLEQLAAACGVAPEWVLRHVEEGCFPGMAQSAAEWRFTAASLRRARRMRDLERDFEAVPQLAALVADLLDEMDELRGRLRALEPR